MEQVYRELTSTAEVVSECISLQISEHKRESELLSHQIQLKIESTRVLQTEYEARLEVLDKLRREQQALTETIPDYAIELERELQRTSRESEETKLQLEQTIRDVTEAQETLRKLEADESHRIASADAMFSRHRQLVLAWESALALRIEPAPGHLTINYVDLNRSFRLLFKDALVHIEQNELPQAVVGRIADQFNENGSFAQLVVNMREAFQSSS